MKFYYLFFFIFFFTKVSAELKLTPILEDLNKPWSVTLKSNSELLITEKSGNIIFFNKKKNIIKKIPHNLKVLEDGQGGLLDILFRDQKVYVSYSEDRGDGKSSTSVAVANYNLDLLNFNNIFQAEPPIASGYHFGSRLVIRKDKLLLGFRLPSL